MKIGIDASPIFHQRGGVGTHTLHLIENLLKLKSDHQFFLYSSRLSDESFPFLTQKNIQLIYGNKLYLRYRIWKERIDIVHGTNFRLPGYGRKGNIITIHDLALVKYPSFGKKFGGRFSFWRTKKRALRADRIIAVSKSVLEDIVQFIGAPEEKIKVIYNGVDPFYFPDDNQEVFLKIRQKFGIKKERYLLFTGTIEPRKNVKTVLKAFSRNKKIRKDFNLVLAGGKGWKNSDIQQFIIDEGLLEEVVITGYISREELRVLYSCASCFVFPSIYEGFGIPLLEAMACGVPVICSNSSSLPEVVGDAAITIDPHDIDGFSTGMEKIVEDEGLRKNMILRGFERVKHFSWEETAKKTLQVYEEVYLS